jgi:O-antigen/teichoic acid export membrane protein
LSSLSNADPGHLLADARPKRLSLKTNFSWTFAGNVLYAGFQWGFLILLAKMLNATAVGEFAFALAVTAPVMIFANQGLTGLQATDAKGEFSFGEYFICRALTTTLALVCIFSGSQLFHWSPVVLLVAAAKAAEAICDIKYGNYQRLDRMDETAKSMILRGGCSLVFAAAFLLLYKSIISATIGLLCGNLLILLLKDYRQDIAEIFRSPAVAGIAIRRTLQDKRKLKNLVLQAFPLGLAAMLGSSVSSIPRYFIEHYSGTAQLGIFAALMYLLVAGRTMIVALAQSCVAQLSRLYVQGLKPAFDRLLGRQMMVGLVLGVLGILVATFAGKILLRLLYRPEYAEHSAVFILVMVAAAFNYLAEFTNGGLLAVRAIRIQPVILTVCCVAILILSFLLIPKFGIYGAAWAVAITGAVQMLANLYFLSRAPFPQADSKS